MTSGGPQKAPSLLAILSSEPHPISTGPAGPRQTLVGVQGLRAVAALMVVVLHAANQTVNFAGDNWAWPLGNAGVDIFFPISGFVMVLIAGRESAGDFVRARLIRILPLYYLVTLGKAALLMLNSRLSLPILAAALAFIPLHDAAGELIWPPIKPGWSLDLEMFYYLAITIALLLRARVWVLAPLLLSGVAIIALIWPRLPLIGGFGGWGDPMVFEFIGGMLIAAAVQRWTWVGRWPWLFIAAAVALYVIYPKDSHVRALTWGGPGLMLLWAALGLETRLAASRIARTLSMLGDASYSIYLTHTLVQPAFSALAGRVLVKALSPWSLIALLVLVSLVTGVIVHLVIERPLLRWIKTLWPPRAANSVALGRP